MNLIDEPSVRIVSAQPAVAEVEINALLGNYSPLVWNISPLGDKMMVTCILVHEREVRRSQLAMPPQMSMNTRRMT